MARSRLTRGQSTTQAISKEREAILMRDVLKRILRNIGTFSQEMFDIEYVKKPPPKNPQSKERGKKNEGGNEVKE